MQHPRQYAQTAPDRPAAIDADTGAVRTYARARRARQPVWRTRCAARDCAPATTSRSCWTTGSRCSTCCGARCDVGPLRHAGELAPRGRRGGVHRRRLRRPARWSSPPTSPTRSPTSAARRARCGSRSAASSPGFDDFERVVAAQPVEPDRRRGRGQLDVLLVGHHRPAQGHQAADHRRAARLAERVQRAGRRALRRRPRARCTCAPRRSTTRRRRAGRRRRSASAATVVVMHRFDAEACLAAIERHRVTHVQFVPTHLVRILKLDPEVRGEVRPVEPAGDRARGRAVPARREARRDRVLRPDPARVLRGQ